MSIYLRDNALGRNRTIVACRDIGLIGIGAGRRRNFVGQHFWAWGYWVSTVGKNEAAMCEYIQNQKKEAKRLEGLELGDFERFALSQAAGFAGGR